MNDLKNSGTLRRMENFHPLEKLVNITEGYNKAFQVDGKEMLLVNSGDETALITNRCPHDGSPLNRARLAKGCLQCPKHKIVFRLTDGSPLGGEVVNDIGALERHKLVQRNDTLGIILDH